MVNTGSIYAEIGADISKYQQAMGKVQQATSEAFAQAKKTAEKGGGAMQMAFETAMRTIANLLPSSMNSGLNKMIANVSSGSSRMQQMFAHIGEKIPESFSKALPLINNTLGIGLANILRDVGGKFRNLAVSTDMAFQTISTAAGRVASYLPQPFATAFSVISKGANNIGTAFSSSFRALERLSNSAANNMARGFVQGLAGIGRAAQSAVNDVVARFTPLINIGAKVGTGLSRGFGTAISGMSRSAGSVLDNIMSRFKRTGGQANQLTGLVTQLAGAFSLVGLASKALGAITNSFDSAISRYDTLNQFPRIMEQWGYSLDEVDRASQKMQAGIDGLPTKLDDITGTVQRLTTITNDLEGSVDIALALNNAFLASGAGAADASRGMEQYMQMLSTGKVDMMSWRTLQETMPGALMQTAEAFGFTGQSATTDFYEALKDGEITFEEFTAQLIELDGAMGGFAEQAFIGTEGVRTAMANLATAVSRNVEKVIRAFDDVAKSRGLMTVQDMLMKARKYVDIFGQAVVDMVPAVVDKFNELGVSGSLALLALPQVAPMAIGALAGLHSPLSLLGTLGMDSANKIGVGMHNAGIDIIEFGNKFGAVGNAMTTSAGVGVSAMGNMAEAITSIAGLALKSIGPAAILGLVLAGLGMINEQFGQEIAKMLSMVQQKGPQIISDLVAGIVSRIPDLIESGTLLVSRFTQAIVANIPAVFNGGMQIIAALVEGVGSNMPVLLQSAITIVSSLANEIMIALPQLIVIGMNLLLSVVQGIVANIPLIVQSAQSMLDTFTQSINTYLPMIIQAGINIILELLNGLMVAMPQLIPLAFQALMTLVNGIMANIPLLMGAATQVILGLVNFLVANLPMILSMTIQLIMTIFNGIIQNLPTIMAAGFQIILAVVQGLAQMMPMILQAGIQLVAQLLVGIVTNLPAIVMMGIAMVVELIKSIITGLPMMFEAGWQMIVELGRGLLEAIPTVLSDAWNGIKDGFSNAWDFITGKSKETGSAVAQDSTAMSSQLKADAWQMNNEVSSSFDGMRIGVLGQTNQLAAQVPMDFNTISTQATTMTDLMGGNVMGNFDAMSVGALTDTGAMAAQIPMDFAGFTGAATARSAEMRNGVAGNTSAMKDTTISHASFMNTEVSKSIDGMVTKGVASSSKLKTGVSQDASGMRSSVTKDVASMSKDGTLQVENMSRAVTKSTSTMQSKVTTDVATAKNNAVSNANQMNSGVSTAVKTMQSSTDSSFRGFANTATAETGKMNTKVTSDSRTMQDQSTQSVKQLERDMMQSFTQMQRKTTNDMKQMVTTIVEDLRRLHNQFSLQMNRIKSTTGIGTREVTNRFKTMGTNNIAAIRSMSSGINSVMSTLTRQMTSHGANAGQGFLNGLNSRRGSITASARSIANSVSATISAALKVRSPSRVMEDIGDNVILGLVNRLSAGVKQVTNAAGQIAEALMLEDYNLEAGITASASIESAGVASKLENLSDDVRNVERGRPVFEVFNELVGDKIYTTVKEKEVRKHATSDFFI